MVDPRDIWGHDSPSQEAGDWVPDYMRPTALDWQDQQLQLKEQLGRIESGLERIESMLDSAQDWRSGIPRAPLTHTPGCHSRGTQTRSSQQHSRTSSRLSLHDGTLSATERDDLAVRAEVARAQRAMQAQTATQYRRAPFALPPESRSLSLASSLQTRPDADSSAPVLMRHNPPRLDESLAETSSGIGPISSVYSSGMFPVIFTRGGGALTDTLVQREGHLVSTEQAPVGVTQAQSISPSAPRSAFVEQDS